MGKTGIMRTPGKKKNFLLFLSGGFIQAKMKERKTKTRNSNKRNLTASDDKSRQNFKSADRTQPWDERGDKADSLSNQLKCNYTMAC